MNDTVERLEKAPLLKLILSLAIPSIIGQFINVLYNIIDRIYIGHMQNGDIALTGVGIVFPIITLISAFSCFVGTGAAPLAAIKLGEKNKDGAEKILGNSLILLLCIALVLTVVFFLFSEPILYMFGASDKSIGYANTYCKIYVLGTLFVQTALGLNPFIVCQGRSKTAMISVVVGAVLNIVLDPIFIFVLNWGVAGAAIATIISQSISSIWIICFLCSKKTDIKIRKKYMRFNPHITKNVVSLGVSQFVMQSTESLVLITVNTGLQKYGGDLYVGVMTIFTSILQIIMVPLHGFNYGVQPIISYNYGAKNIDRVKKCFKLMLVISLGLSLSVTTSVCIFARPLTLLFASNEQMIGLSTKMMPIFFCGMSIFGAQSACQTTFVGLGQAKISLFLAVFRKIIMLIPLAIVIPMIFNTAESVFFAEPISDFIASITTFTIFMLNINKILNKRKSNV